MKETIPVPNPGGGMSIHSVSFIQGLSIGMEFVDAIPSEDIPNSIVIDFFVIRIVLQIGK